MKIRRAKLTIVGPAAIGTLLIIIFSVLLVGVGRFGLVVIEEGIARNGRTMLAVSSRLAFDHLDTLEVADLNAILEEVQAQSTIVHASIWNADGELVTQTDSDWSLEDGGIEQDLTLQAIEQGEIVEYTTKSEIILVSPIEKDGVQIGAMHMVVDLGLLLAEIGNSLLSLLINAAVLLLISLIVVLVGANYLVRPLRELVASADRIKSGDLETPVSKGGLAEFQLLGDTLEEMRQGLLAARDDLEYRVRAVLTSSRISQGLSAFLDAESLATNVVEQVRHTFKYYHTHIYLFDETKENLVMVGGTGEVGQVLLNQKHTIEAGKGLVGRTAATNKPTLVADVATDPDWLPNSLLPETKAEAAVPITLDGEVLGVLDVQNNVAGSLGEADIDLLLLIAGQVAIGLQNAKLFAQAQQEKAQFQSILGSISLPIVISYMATGVVAYVNQALAETFRLSREQLIGQVTPDFYANPDDRARFLTALREEGAAKDFEMIFKRGDGERFWGLASGRLITYEGEPAIAASIMDIHARKDAENLLAKKANELSTVAKVSTAAATILDPQELLQQVADLTKSNFDLYHAHIHLLDDRAQTLVLTAGAGEVGRQMVAEGRRIPLSATGSLVASVARNVEGAIRNYESPEEGFMPHALLAATRSEMAVPIAIGKQVLGVLDVRSEQLNHFDEADLQTVTTLASQVAVALQNARSYTRSEQAIQELQELSRRLTREGWSEFFDQQLDELTFRYDLEVSQVLPSDEEPAAKLMPDKETMQAQSLLVQGESIGELLVDSAKLNKDEASEIVAAVAERLSVHLENLRLAQQTQNALNETQQRTEELAILIEMSQSLTAQTSVDGVFQTVYDYLSGLMDTTNFFTVTYDEENDEVEFVLTASGSELHWYTERRQAGHGVTEYLIRQRQPLLIPDNVGRQLAVLGIAGYGKLPESWLGVPIMLGDRVLGLIGLESYTTPRLYNEQHLNLLTAVANQAAIAIESTRLLESSVALAEEEQILRQITTRVSTAIDAESILRTAAEEIGRALGLEGYVSLELETVGSNGTNGHERAAKSHD